MAKTFTTLQSMTRTYLDEATEADFDDTEIKRELNEGYHKTITAVISVWEDYYLTTHQFNTVEDQQEYDVSTDSVPSDIYKIRRVEINYDVDNSNSQASRALPIKIDEVRNDLGNTNVGSSVVRNPAYYTYGFGSNFKIGFIPIPSESGTNAVKIWYIAEQADLSASGDAVNIPYSDRYAPIIALYAAGKMLRKGQQDEVASKNYMTEFEIGLEKMKEEIIDRMAEDSKGIIDTIGEVTDFSDFTSLY